MNTTAVEATTSNERRFGTKEMVDELLSERQDMLVKYLKVTGCKPFTHEKSIQEELKEFCEVLVDYTAFTHFEIYERILDGKERRRSVIEIAQQVHPNIVGLTEQIVSFNDKYDESDHELILNHLEDDLASLGQIIAERIELEDRIVNALRA